jgi:hypothetical protein
MAGECTLELPGTEETVFFSICGPTRKIPLQKNGAPPTRTKRSEREAGTYFNRVPGLSVCGAQLPLPHTSSRRGDYQTNLTALLTYLLHGAESFLRN